MRKRKSIRHKILETYPDETFVFFDGFDEAILGIEEESMRVIYSVSISLQIIYNGMKVTKNDLDSHDKEAGMTIRDKRMEMSREHFEYNVRGSKGDGFPIWCDDKFDF